MYKTMRIQDLIFRQSSEQGKTLLPPPPGVFHNPSDSQKVQNIVCHTACLTMVTLGIVLRFYTRTLVVKAFGWDDCMYLFYYVDCVAH